METKGIKRTFVVSFNHACGDKAVLIVGETKRNTNVMEVISAFQGKEAIDIFKKLIKEE